ncbi:MAG: hypothetical protein KJ077_30890 [Anaerolineae bacterium]|nr:hypothetical protein [Anaerolineae bacterium]
MSFLKRIWEDIRRGENIDLYATVIIAFSLVILGLVGITPAGLVASLTLTVLGLLAVSNLVNRYRLEELSQKLSQSTNSFFLQEFPSDFKENLVTGKDIWLISVALSGILKGNYQIIEEKLRKGHTIRILVVHPEGAPVEMAASRYYADVRRNAETTALQIKNNLQLFCSLRNVAPKRIEIRTIQNPLTFGAVCVNPDTASGVLYLEHFPYRTVSDALPRFTLRASDGYWYDFFNKEVHALWNSATVWECSE